MHARAAARKAHDRGRAASASARAAGQIRRRTAGAFFYFFGRRPKSAPPGSVPQVADTIMAYAIAYILFTKKK